MILHATAEYPYIGLFNNYLSSLIQWSKSNNNFINLYTYISYTQSFNFFQIFLRVSSSSPIPGSTTTTNATTVPLTSKEMVAEAYAEKLRTDPEIQAALQPDVLDRDPDDALKKALLFPLLELEPPKNCLFLLVDSIDEGQTLDLPQTGTRDSRRENDNVSRTIAELLANHHHLFPQWLLLVCTARRQSKPISRMFSGFRKIPLDDLRKSLVVRDIQQYILARLDQEDALRCVLDFFLS